MNLTIMEKFDENDNRVFVTSTNTSGETLCFHDDENDFGETGLTPFQHIANTYQDAETVTITGENCDGMIHHSFSEFVVRYC